MFHWMFPSGFGLMATFQSPVGREREREARRLTFLSYVSTDPVVSFMWDKVTLESLQQSVPWQTGRRVFTTGRGVKKKQFILFIA